MFKRIKMSTVGACREQRASNSQHFLFSPYNQCG